MHRSIRWFTRLAVVLAVAALFAVPASATTAVQLSVEDMVDVSDVIVTGTAASSRTVWVDRVLVTVVTVQVDEVLKGAPGSSLEVVVPGGVDSNRPVPVGVTYAGAPVLGRDEAVVLFLTEQELLPSGYTVAGFSQGKLSIVETPQGKKATRDLSGLTLQAAGTGEPVVRTGTTSVPLDRYLDQVRALVGTGNAR